MVHMLCNIILRCTLLYYAPHRYPVCFFLSQVVPDHHLRVKQHGEPITIAETESWQALAAEFFRVKEGESSRDAKQRVQQKRATAPRLATLDLMRALQHQIYAGLGVSLSTFDNIKALSDAEITFPDVGGDPQTLPRAPTSLTLVGDEQSTQWSSFNYIVTKLKYCVVTLNDPFHRFV